MKLHAWVAKQGWIEVAYVVDYFDKPDHWGSFPFAKVVLFDGSVFDASLEYQLFYNLQGE